MRILSPEWLILLPVFFFAGWRWRALELWRPLRVATLLLLLLILVQPQWRRLGEGLDVWVLVDRSASAADAMAERLDEIETLLARTKSRHDRLFFVDYSDVAVVRDEGTGAYSGSPQRTRTALAAAHALSRMSPDRASRLLVVTDGFSTEPLDDLAERLARQGVPMDYRLVSPPDVRDFGIAALRLPARVQPGEPFLIEVEAVGATDETVPLEIARNGARIATGEVTIRNGRGQVRFTDRIREGGSHRYEVRLKADADARSGNDAANAWIEIQGGPRIVLVTNYTDDPVAKALRAQGVDVEVIAEPSTVDVGRLSGAKVVILNNVPAFEMPSDFVSALDFFVRVQGGGLWMIGGKFSFGSGGWFGSPIDDLLPVSMELRMEHRKLAVAMAIVMDRSGSMGATVGGGATKMDLANEGAARAIELLGPNDAVTVLAVDSEPHIIVPLTSLGANRGQIVDAVRRITSGGGGIFVHTGMEAGWEQLQTAQAGQRHMILFADAADAEEPGQYKKLLAQMIGAGATVSVIALGSSSDSDAAFLEDVAMRGGGRIFFNADAATLPALFEQETVAVARSAFIEEATQVEPSAGWLEIAARPMEWLPSMDGYNLSYLKPDATAAAYSADEYAAPLVAFWQRGAGRAAAVSFPLGGPFSEKVRAWGQYGDFVQTLARWLGGEDLPPGIGLLTRIEGEQLDLQLLFDDAWGERFAAEAPRITVADGASGEGREVTWERLSPGRYRASIPLESGKWLRGAVQAGKFVIPFGPVSGGIHPEWQFDAERVRELQAVSTASGGVDRVELGEIWKAPRRQEFRDLRPPLLVLMLCVFLADALLTRLGYRLPTFAKIKPPQISPIRPKRRPVSDLQPVNPVPTPEVSPVESPDEGDRTEERRSRFRRAKSRGR